MIRANLAGLSLSGVRQLHLTQTASGLKEFTGPVCFQKLKLGHLGLIKNFFRAGYP